MAEPIPKGGTLRLGDRDKAITAAAAEREANAVSAPWQQALRKGIVRENFISAWYTDKFDHWGKPNPGTIPFARDPNYRFEEDEANLNYDPARMSGAKSAGEARQWRAEIDQEKADLDIINSTAWGTLGQFAGAVGSPQVVAAAALAPVSIPGMVAAEFALEGASEYMLHQQQRTRTIEESLWNAGLTAATAGILAGAASYWARTPKRDLPPDAIDEINAGIHPGGSGDSAGAAKVLEEDQLTKQEDSLVGGRLAEFLSIGQMSHLVGSTFQASRNIASKLADNPLFTKGMEKGKTRGVSVESLQEAAMGRVVVAADKVAALSKKSGLDRDTFEQQVGSAMSNGDRHTNLRVQQAAEVYRKEVIDPIREASERLGILDNVDEMKVKIKELEETVTTLATGAKGINVKMEAIESARGKLVASREAGLQKLAKAVEASQKKLDKARAPGKDGKKKVASPQLRDSHNEMRKALTAYRKETADKVKEYRKSAKELRVQKQELAAARKATREMQTKIDNPGVSFAESYFPRIYNRDAMYDNWGTVKLAITKHFRENRDMAGKYEPAEIELMVQDTMLNMVAGRSQGIKGDGTPTALRARVLSMMDNELEALGIVEKNATQGMIRHAQAMQPYLIMREAFDGQGMREMLTTIDDELDVLIGKAGDDGAEVRRLTEEAQADKDRLKVIHNRLMHNVQRAVDPGGAAEKATQFAKALNTATYLGGVVLSSVPDLARPIANYGLRSFGKGLAKGMAQAFAGRGSLGSVQVKRTGAALQRTLNDRVMQLTDSLEPMGKWTGRLQRAWEKTSLFGVWTDTMESVAAHSAMDWTLRMANKSLDGTLTSKADIRQLTRMGLTSEDLALIARESERTVGAQDTTLKYMNTMEWQDMDLAKRVEAAIGSDVRRTIIRIGAGEKPAMMDGTTWSWLLQFQSFAMSAQNKILVAGIQNPHAIRTAQSLIAMMALGAGVGATKATLRGDDVSDWPAGQWVAEGIDRSGMSGALRIPFNLLRYVGSQTESGAEFFGEPSRFIGRELEGIIAGPTISTVGHAWRAGSQAMDGDMASAGEHLWKATPLGNTWHIRNVLMDLGDN